MTCYVQHSYDYITTNWGIIIIVLTWCTHHKALGRELGQLRALMAILDMSDSCVQCSNSPSTYMSWMWMCLAGFPKFDNVANWFFEKSHLNMCCVCVCVCRPERVRMGMDIVLHSGFSLTSDSSQPVFQRQRSKFTKVREREYSMRGMEVTCCHGYTWQDLAGLIFEEAMQKLLEDEWLKQFK